VTTIDLGPVSRDEFDPGEPAVTPERRRRGAFALLLVTTVLIGATGATPPAHAVQAAALSDLAEVERVEIFGDIAVGVVPDTGEVVAVSLDTGRLRWRHDSGFNGRPSVQIADGLVILDTGAGSPRQVSIVDLDTGRPVARADGSALAPATRGIQAVRRVDESGSIARAIGPGGDWVTAWPPESTPIPVYAHGRRTAAVVALESDGRVRRLDLLTGAWTSLGRMEAGDTPIGLYDGRLQVRQDSRGPGFITVYDTTGGLLNPVWAKRVSGSDPPRLMACGAFLCSGTFSGTRAYDLEDGGLRWAVDRFRITASAAGADGEPILTGVLTDDHLRSEEAILDPARGRLVAALGPWRLGAVLGGRAFVYRSGVAGRAWFGEVDLGSPAARVRTTLHLPVPAQRCDFGERWAVCQTGVADQPPYAIPIAP